MSSLGIKLPISGNAKDYAVLLGAAALVAAGLFLFAKGQLKQAAGAVTGTVGGTLSGNNAITKGTAYEGKGIAGTLGGAVDKVTGGLTSAVGGWLGSWWYDVVNPPYDPNSPNTPVVRKHAAATSPVLPSDKPTVYVQ